MAVEKLQIYKCSLCGNIIEVVHVGGGTLVCCGKDMDLVVENTTDAATEKHVPVVEKVDGGYKVTDVDDSPIPWHTAACVRVDDSREGIKMILPSLSTGTIRTSSIRSWEYSFYAALMQF